MTFSVVARCPRTSAVGGAVLTRNLAVGGYGPGVGVLWVRGGAGAVVTQSFTDPTYGPRGLSLMESGVSGPDALAQLLAQDAGTSGLRQLAFLDRAGQGAAHTGHRCVAHQGHVVTDDAVFVANMMRSPGVPEAMANSWRHSSEERFARRLLLALQAGEAAGGDLRGRQSAALRIAPAHPDHAEQLLVDVRVDDAPDPLAELDRLEHVACAYAVAEEAATLDEQGDHAGAQSRWQEVRRLLPDSPDAAFWSAVSLAQAGQICQAQEAFAFAFERQPGFTDLLPRLLDAGTIDLDPRTLQQLHLTI